jgi:hypothetical protein
VSDRAREFHQLYAALRIEDQLAFYRSRAAEYRTAHRQAVVVRNSLLFAAAALRGRSRAARRAQRGPWWPPSSPRSPLPSPPMRR